jgi:hypothetical protein
MSPLRYSTAQMRGALYTIADMEMTMINSKNIPKYIGPEPGPINSKMTRKDKQ